MNTTIIENKYHDLINDKCFDSRVEINTTKQSTPEALQDFIDSVYLRRCLGLGLSPIAFVYQEPPFHDARHASEHKATIAKQYCSEGLGAGTDVAFGIWDKNRKRWISLTKLDRLGRPLTQEEIVREFHSLENWLCHGENHFYWQVSLSLLNGQMHTTEEFIFADTKEIPKAVLQQKYNEAVMSGIYTKTNPRFLLFESLMEFGLVKRIGVVPGEVVRNNQPLDGYMMEPTHFVMDYILRDIITKVPHAALHVGDL